jgi:hypothetical protein
MVKLLLQSFELFLVSSAWLNYRILFFAALIFFAFNPLRIHLYDILDFPIDQNQYKEPNSQVG